MDVPQCRKNFFHYWWNEELDLLKEASIETNRLHTAETISEIIKYMSDVEMRGRVRMGSKSEIFRFFNSGYAHDRNISIFRRRASRVTENTLI